MARKRAVNYFKEINSDEELDQLLENKVLIILDVYQEIFGPCTTSLHGTLEKAKLSLQDSDKLLLAVCDARKVEKLNRFLTCIPTIVFCSHKKVVEILYGANIPRLAKTIQEQLELETKYSEGKVERKFYEFDEPLPFERPEIERKRAEEEEARLSTVEKAAAELHAKLDNIIQLMQDNASDMGVTIFMPHVVDIAIKRTADVGRTVGLFNRARAIIRIQKEMLPMLNYRLANSIDSGILEHLYGKDMMAVLWSVDMRSSITESLSEFVTNVNEPLPALDENGNRISGDFPQRVLDPFTVYLDEKDDVILTKDNESITHSSISAEVESRESETRESSAVDLRRSHRLSRVTQRRSTAVFHTDDDGRPKLIIPAVWTPANQAGNAILMYTFFANQFNYFLPPEPEPVPPHLCMMFPASKYSDALEVCKKYPKELLAFGFFTGDGLEDCQLVCKSTDKYEQGSKQDSDKIVMKVAKRTSHLLLALTTLDPLYVSHNIDEGVMECAIIFNESFEAHEDNEEAENKS